MNTIKFGDKVYKYEGFWRDNYDKKEYDSEDKELPYPEHQIKQKLQNVESFLNKLESVEDFLREKEKFTKYEKPKRCLLCHQKNITTGLFSSNNIRWEDGLKHYINVHNIKPTEDFVDFIYRFGNSKKREISRIKGVKVTKSGKKYLKLERNQILIMDALMKHGGYKIYKDKRKNDVFRYSEHAGLLDFNNHGLEKIIVSGNTTRVDAGDNDIYLPKDLADIYDYEYIFHTHPPTPKPGGRVELGIMYEFPSIGDLFHFKGVYNEGNTQGSIVIAPEGMYVISKKNFDDKKIVLMRINFIKSIIKYTQILIMMQ